VLGCLTKTLARTIVINGTVAGGIGVGGADGDEDVRIARARLKALEE